MADRSDRSARVESLVTGYGHKEVLRGVDLHIGAGEVVALIGHNGAGKSTLLKAVFGMLPVWQGTISLFGNVWKSWTPRQAICLGAAYVPQGNRVFSDLSVRENLEMGGVTLRNKRQLEQGLERALTQFPALKTRLRQRAGTLSGGEKQMLALANALIVSPRLLLLDEPSLGLAPQLVAETLRRIQGIARTNGTAVLIVEQKVREVLKIADRVYVFRNGRVSFNGSAKVLKDDAKLKEVYL